MIRVTTKPTKVRGLNASTSEDATATLTSAQDKLRDISTSLASIITEQVSDPEYQEGKAVLAERLMEWTADIFAISEDMRFYLNPPIDEKGE
jgi:hypothetical protein